MGGGGGSGVVYISYPSRETLYKTFTLALVEIDKMKNGKGHNYIKRNRIRISVAQN